MGTGLAASAAHPRPNNIWVPPPPPPPGHELAVTVSHRATPIPSPQLSGVEGALTYASVEEADHQCWLVVVSNIVFVRVFSVEYSNMYNLSINELYVYYGEICIFAPIIA